MIGRVPTIPPVSEPARGDRDRERGARVARAFSAWFAERQRAIAALQGNPAGIEVREFGPALAYVAPGCRQWDWMTGAHVPAATTPGALGEILAWFRSRGLRPRIEREACGGGPGAEARLAAAGLARGATMEFRARDPATPTEAPAGIAVSPVDPADAETFARIRVEGSETPPRDLETYREHLRVSASLPGVRTYLARIGAEPVGAATLVLREEAAYFSSAAVLPPYRRRGVHTALIARRLADAAAAGCDLAFVRTEEGSPSAASLARAGFRVVARREVWRPTPPPASESA